MKLDIFIPITLIIHTHKKIFSSPFIYMIVYGLKFKVHRLAPHPKRKPRRPDRRPPPP